MIFISFKMEKENEECLDKYGPGNGCRANIDFHFILKVKK